MVVDTTKKTIDIFCNSEPAPATLKYPHDPDFAKLSRKNFAASASEDSLLR